MVSVLLALLLITPTTVHAQEPLTQGYITIIEGEDWGPAVTKLLIPISNGSIQDGKVIATKHATSSTGESIEMEGEVSITTSYRSDAAGNKDDQGAYTALVLQIHPDDQLTNPFYFDIEAFHNSWADISYTITSKEGTWSVETDRKKVGSDDFKKGSHSYQDEEFGEINLQYAAYSPVEDDTKNPLIIWLHGMGEGGVDPELVLLGNEVTALAREDIQSYFNGAYVFAPQTPTFWLDNGTGSMTEDGNSMYTRALMDTIDAYVKENGDIDLDRIYIGGCSNGGFMTMRMIMSYPEYFAAAYPICDAMYDAFITDQDIQRIKHIPIWFTHASSDALAMVGDTSIPTYQRLMEAGATNTHFSIYDAVIDKSNTYQDKDGAPYMYNAHYSWIYTLNNEPKLDFEGNPVMIEDKEVTIFEWLSNQTKQPSEYRDPTFLESYGMLIAAGVSVVLVVGLTCIGSKRKKDTADQK